MFLVNTQRGLGCCVQWEVRKLFMSWTHPQPTIRCEVLIVRWMLVEVGWIGRAYCAAQTWHEFYEAVCADLCLHTGGSMLFLTINFLLKLRIPMLFQSSLPLYFIMVCLPRVLFVSYRCISILYLNLKCVHVLWIR